MRNGVFTPGLCSLTCIRVSWERSAPHSPGAAGVWQRGHRKQHAHHGKEELLPNITQREKIVFWGPKGEQVIRSGMGKRCLVNGRAPSGGNLSTSPIISLPVSSPTAEYLHYFLSKVIIFNLFSPSTILKDNFHKENSSPSPLRLSTLSCQQQKGHRHQLRPREAKQPVLSPSLLLRRAENGIRHLLAPQFGNALGNPCRATPTSVAH